MDQSSKGNARRRNRSKLQVCLGAVVAVAIGSLDSHLSASLTGTVCPRQPNGSAGGAIAFSSDRDGNFEIYVMNPDGSNQQRLTRAPGDDMWPCWSPDGTQIAFHSHRDGNREVYIMNAHGGGERRLTYNPSSDGTPT